MKLSQLRQVLLEHGLRLSKSLGQNFLHDANQLRRIVAAAELSGSDRVLEIGPGLGALTALLVQQAGEVLAIEKDIRLFRLLEQRFAIELKKKALDQLHNDDLKNRGQGVLRLIRADALDFLRQQIGDWREWKLVSNLPYSVASPILVELAQAELGPERLVATLQIEVAQRLVAKPGDTNYGLLTLLIQMNYHTGPHFKIPASCFFPAPEVDSACVSLIRRKSPIIGPEYRQAFVDVLKRSFSQRRKMMLKLLKTDWSAERLERAFQASELSPNVRAETVGLEQFAELTKQLINKAGD
jgi:16S rRNA (adenine1518-N6/adenine1519-N6)-dimethyltransferase